MLFTFKKIVLIMYAHSAIYILTILFRLLIYHEQTNHQLTLPPGGGIDFFPHHLLRREFPCQIQ